MGRNYKKHNQSKILREKQKVRKGRSNDGYMSIKRKLKESERFLHSSKIMSRLEALEQIIRNQDSILQRKLKPIEKDHTPEIESKKREEVVKRVLFSNTKHKSTLNISKLTETARVNQSKSIHTKSVMVQRHKESMSSSQSNDDEVKSSIIMLEIPVKEPKTLLHRILMKWKSVAE